ncbi:hypothetical protein D3C71_814690 [compost metagenome]
MMKRQQYEVEITIEDTALPAGSIGLLLPVPPRTADHSAGARPRMASDFACGTEPASVGVVCASSRKPLAQADPFRGQPAFRTAH